MSEDLRIIKTKQNIERVFLKLLETKDFEQITIKDISQQALIGKSTFYYHYTDKYDLAQKLIHQELINYQQLLTKRLALGLQDHLLVQLHQLSQKLLCLRKIRSSEINVDQLIKQALATALEDQLPATISPLTARLLAGLIFECLLAYEDGSFQQSSSSIQQVITQIKDVFQLIYRPHHP
ncbi:TetR/AcrR family transcriptional regulator [Levilactobacillus namurensis]|uniref:TetR/AcrR family transcriptional regulator n=1 Tax=Levilactobacillus namurensis TaxID=380393 RepID=UPI001DF652AD|nr:TetR family transcriptional regulator [Levilactobacillus namurensis]HJE45846.1 TetR/AcrR family transcriptional regulator [Levilactobacillus namurensis]